MPAINLVTTVELERVAPVGPGLPARSGCFSGPPNGDHRLEAMFDGIVKRVGGKLDKRQAVVVVTDAVPLLIVEMSQSELTSELRHSCYLPEFQRIVSTRLADLREYSVVAFCEADG